MASAIRLSGAENARVAPGSVPSSALWLAALTLRLMLAWAWLLAPAPARAGAETPAAEVQQAPGPEHGKLATSDATPVAAGGFEVEVAFGPSWNLHGSGDFDHSARGATYASGLALTYGIVDGLDAGVELGYATAFASAHDHDMDGIPSGSAHGHGYTDTLVGARWRILSLSGAALAVAVVSNLVLPTGADASVDRVGLSQVYWSFESALVASRDWGSLTANVEVGYSLPFGNDRGSERGVLFANLAGGWQALPWLQPELELSYRHAYEAAPEPDADLICATGGALVLPGDGYRVAGGVRFATWGRHTGQFVEATLAIKRAF